MNFRVRVEAPAARDIETAFDWYESRRTGLGTDLLRAIAAAQDVLAREPRQFPETREPFRWYKLRRFPYGLHYRIKGDEVLIVACLHFRQSPVRWPGG